ncbi:hypothetical protein RJ639_018183 [Escallonia herrerae]|uniref:Rho-GAP domain-containing protein n=1 Tax=Escallonia herrerae TaxID=1293975 RepID=A0AA89AJ89_9ASTE|nr:hypothetical protein RJ639_018183 [Escallonia herrerae]
MMLVTKGGGCGAGAGDGHKAIGADQDEQNQLSLVALLLSALRKSMWPAVWSRGKKSAQPFTIWKLGGRPTFSTRPMLRLTVFKGFWAFLLSLKLKSPADPPAQGKIIADFESGTLVSVFGVSAESMQCSYDARGNSVPTMLLLMQERLYTQGGLKAEGIFRINPENSQEEHVRDQLNRGIVPQDIDVHCLAGLIKAWFRELPSGVLDGLSPEEVLQCNTEEESFELVKQLRPTDAALLNWAIDLMANVVEQEDSKKMNARNIAMVFAPNMTQMSDPLTALMHAVQVMNLLKTLIMKSLREREETATGGYSPMSSRSSGMETHEEFNSQQEMDTSCELK